MHLLKTSVASRLTVGLLLCWLALPAVGCGEGDAGGNDGADQEVFSVSDSGHFEARMVLRPNPPVVGDNELMLYLGSTESMSCCSGESVSGAELTVVPWMPGHGHGSPKTPEVIEEGDGTYLVTNLFYSMPGHWELQIDVVDEHFADTFVVDLQVE